MAFDFNSWFARRRQRVERIQPTRTLTPISTSDCVPDRVKRLKPQVNEALRNIEPSVDEGGLRLYPCDVELEDGTEQSRVYLVDAQQYIRAWGVWPWQDAGKNWIPAESIRAARPSTERLAPRCANILYAAGESGMGYCAFSVDLRDGRRLYLGTGNAVDFPGWPQGVSPADVVAVNPGDRDRDPETRRQRVTTPAPQYSWSPFRPFD